MIDTIEKKNTENDNIDSLLANLENIVNYIKENPYSKGTNQLIKKIDEEIPFWITRKCNFDNLPTSFYITGDILYRAGKELEKVGLIDYY